MAQLPKVRMDNNSALSFSVTKMVFGSGQLGMDLSVLILSVLFFILNGFILFRQWPSKRDGHETSSLKLLILVDPLITAIVCPMTSDLYFIPEWGSGCSATYTAVITGVILILYVSSLFVCYWLTQLALPSPSIVSTHHKLHRLLCWTPSSCGPLRFAFLTSIAMNILLTCIMLPVVSKHFDVIENFDSEICQPFFLVEMMLNVFVICVSIQIAYTGLYFCICKVSLSEQELDRNEKTDHRYTSNMKIVVIHALTALLCLISACLLRFIFITCSCKGLFDLSKSLPTVTFLLTLKLPCTFTVSHFWPKKVQVDYGT